METFHINSLIAGDCMNQRELLPSFSPQTTDRTGLHPVPLTPFKEEVHNPLHTRFEMTSNPLPGNPTVPLHFLKKYEMSHGLVRVWMPSMEREGGRRGWWAERVRASARLCDYYITVITKRLKKQSCILCGLQGNWFCVQRG